ncbi:MAG TPA: hypothetical protein VNO53_07715, partial [Steroidobacteraceae bacterium]|nr:hypothetical protein [Steroidobacteraceae bacterium]
EKDKDPKDPGVQGEGDYISGRRYQKNATRFAHQHDTEELAREAAPESEAEQKEMLEAEDKGKARAKGKKPDPQ